MALSKREWQDDIKIKKLVVWAGVAYQLGCSWYGWLIGVYELNGVENSKVSETGLSDGKQLKSLEGICIKSLVTSFGDEK